MANNLVIAKSTKHAASLKDDKSVYLGGGTEINRLNSSVKADTLISLSKTGMNGIEKVKCDNSDFSFIKIGSMCTFQSIIESSIIPGYLKEACRFMSSIQRRYKATIGGNIASARDDSYLVATLLCAQAQLELMTVKGKTVFAGLCDYLSDNEYRDCLIVSVLLADDDSVIITKRYSNTAASHSVMTVCASYSDGYTLVCAVIKGSGVFMFTPDDIPAVRFKDDIYGSKEYKKYLLKVTVEELCTKVLGGAK